MIPSNFTYQRASNVDEALTLLAKHGDDAKLLAGGHSLLPAMKLRLNAPEVLIDIGRIKDLRYIRREGKSLKIGAGATHDDILQSEDVKGSLPFFSEAAGLIGDVQVRNAGTIGGSIAHADPAADWPALLLAADARIHLRGTNGSRTLNAADFFTGFYMTALEPNELIIEIEMDIPEGSGSSYQKFMQPASRFAIVGCAALVKVHGGKFEEVRIGFTGVSDMPFRDGGVEDALRGQRATAETIADAVKKAAADQDVLSDHFASVEYRSHLARVYARKAISAAAGI